MSAEPIIAVENLSISFGMGAQRVDAVKNVSFTVAPGESFGLVGESGSGKSTILRALAGLNDDWTGKMRIGGHQVGRKRPPELRRMVQMVFQDPYGSLHPKHTVDRILSEPLVIHGFDDVEARVRAALDQVGLLGKERLLPLELSVGEQQRVGIARAIVSRPPLLIADEPTGNLDPELASEVMSLFRRLNDVGVTVVVATHDLHLVRESGRREIVLDHGRVQGAGEADLPQVEARR